MAKKLIYAGGTNDLAVFEKRVKKAKECGFTHVDISRFVDRSRWENDDPKDPWLQWNMGTTSFFRVIVPDELKDFVPPETAADNLALITAKGKILEKYGLKGIFSSHDPSWLPESFFDIHPDWRGPRIDHPRRAVHKRFSACMDHPGVLKLYRDTVCRFLTLVPSIDTLTLYSNDSGSGMCWSEYLYNGKNGPSHCKNISVGKRVAKFLQEIRNGAMDAGITAEVTMSAQFSATEIDGILSELPEGTGLMDWDDWRIARGQELFVKMPIAPAYSPMLNIPHYYALADMPERTRTANKVISYIPSAFDDTHDDYLDMIHHMLSKETYNILDRNALLEKMAERQVGRAHAPDLMKAWELIDTGMASFNAPRVGNNLLWIAVVMEKWISRPLVPFPLELTEEENGYYRMHQFQAKGDATAADMMNCQDAYFIDSRAGASFLETYWSFAIIDKFNEACAILRRIAAALNDANRCEELTATVFALEVLLSLARTCIHICHFQTFMYLFPEPESVAEATYDRGDHNRQFIYEIYRAEIDNTRTLMRLLRDTPRPVLSTGARADQEDVNTLSPNIAEHLEKKIKIMMDHWQDFDRIFPRPNK